MTGFYRGYERKRGRESFVIRGLERGASAMLSSNQLGRIRLVFEARKGGMLLRSTTGGQIPKSI